MLRYWNCYFSIISTMLEMLWKIFPVVFIGGGCSKEAAVQLNERHQKLTKQSCAQNKAQSGT